MSQQTPEELSDLQSPTGGPELPPSGLELLSGIAPPDGPLGGLTEIRIHGVGGATPQQILGGNPILRQVAGDRVAGFYRTTDHLGRHVEAYSWGGLTSRGRTRVLWILLLPFLLANLAGWMAPAPKPGSPPVSHWYRFAARASSLSVTLAVLAVLCLLSLDLLAYQCGGSEACRPRLWWPNQLDWGLVEHPARRLLVGALLPLAALVLFAALSYASRNRYELVEPPRPLAARDANPSEQREGPDGTSAAALLDGLADRYFWNGKLAHIWLSRLHLAAGLGMVATALAWCTSRVVIDAQVGTTHAWTGWAGGVLGALAILIVLVALISDTPIRGLSTGVLLTSVLAVVSAGWFAITQSRAPTTSGALPGMVTVFNATWWLIGGALLHLFIVLVTQRAASTRRGRARSMAASENDVGGPDRPARAADLDKTFGSFAPCVLLGFGLILTHLCMLAIVVFIAGRLGTVQYYWPQDDAPAVAAGVLHLPQMVEIAIVYLVIGALVMLLAFLLIQFVRYLRSRNRSLEEYRERRAGTDYPDLATRTQTQEQGNVSAWFSSAICDRPETPWSRLIRLARTAEPDRTDGNPRPTRWLRRAVLWRCLARATPAVATLLNILAGAALLVATAVWVLFLTDNVQYLPQLPPRLTDFAVAIALAIPPGLMLVLAVTWRRLDRRRILSVLWDVGTFWPRSFHPFAPPSYSERAVPDIIRRIWWLHDNDGRVMLAAHSQGSLVAAAAVLSGVARTNEKPIALVTFGSPLRKLYHWAFPAWVTLDHLCAIAKGSTSITASPWTNVYYPTDYIGGPVGRHHSRSSAQEGGSTSTDECGRRLNTVDERLTDPPTDIYLYGQDPPRILTHTGYWTDSRLNHVLDDAAEELERNARVGR